MFRAAPAPTVAMAKISEFPDGLTLLCAKNRSVLPLSRPHSLSPGFSNQPCHTAASATRLLQTDHKTNPFSAGAANFQRDTPLYSPTVSTLCRSVLSVRISFWNSTFNIPGRRLLRPLDISRQSIDFESFTLLKRHLTTLQSLPPLSVFLLVNAHDIATLFSPAYSFPPTPACGPLS